MLARAVLIALAWLLLRPTRRQLRRVLHMLSLIDLHGVTVADQRPLRFYEITLTAEQRDWALAILHAAGVTSAKRKVKAGVLDAFEAARLTDLAPHRVDWDALEREAEARGGTLVDLAWDKGHRREDEAA